MTVKRNDPCPCGSGKKYKHCCMKADRAKAQAEEKERQAALHRPPAPAVTATQPTVVDTGADSDADEALVPDEPEAVDPEQERLNQLYETFEEATHEEKKAILRSAIEEKALDGELAFEFFNDLHAPMVERDERAEFVELTSLLKTQQPELYATENQWFWSWEVHNALAMGDDVALQQAVDQLIANGGQDLDQFFPVFSCLLYHDCRPILLNALDRHSLHIVQGKYFPGVEYEVNQKFSDLILINYIETQPADELLEERNFEALCAALAPYTVDLLRDQLATFIRLAGGLKRGEWHIDDFAFAPPPPKRDMWYDEDEEEEEEPKQDPAIAHLRDLSNEFLHYARYTEQIPLTKAELAREGLANYILQRSRGELTDEPSSRGPGRRKRSRIARSKTESTQTNVLLPDHKSLDRYLTRFYGFLANRHYEGAACFELIPTWVRFLVFKGLAEEAEGQQALRSLQAMSQSMVRLAERDNVDPALAENMRKWQANAGL